ncbi:hypothetical protein ACIQF5_20520 [Streptomyces goshikiensis]|uniref:hypothetical protein n=1 Tax=Streptomyces goshikiensis TaxID=1942 RepID=UPI00381B1E26
MTTLIRRPATVTSRIDAPTTPAPAPVMSAEEHQLRPQEELADDIIVCGVAYSRTKWDAAEGGVHRTTTAEDNPRRVRAAEEAPAARRAPSARTGNGAPV